jgi:hypothetical protein
VVYRGVARVALGLLLVIGCSSKAEPPRREPAHEPPAGPASTQTGTDPSGASDPSDPGAAIIAQRAEEPPRPAGRAQARQARPIEIVLRSSPGGATAAVDGVPLGPTPAYWGGEANGREHEFTFVMQGYASARYRFVPITSGVVHARLEVLAEETDAGVPPELVRVPPGAPAPVPAPPPAAAPLDAAAPPVDPASGTGPQP